MKRIFLVEDDKAIAKNLILLLRSEGFTVTHAPTRGDSLAGNKFDLALVDISLPDGNGFTVCTEIKEMQDIPVIFLTASGDEVFLSALEYRIYNIPFYLVLPLNHNILAYGNHSCKNGPLPILCNNSSFFIELLLMLFVKFALNNSNISYIMVLFTYKLIRNCI